MRELIELGAELDRQAAEYLQETEPLLFDALELCAIRDVSPAQVRAFVLRRVGTERSSFVATCEAAVRWLAEQRIRK